MYYNAISNLNCVLRVKYFWQWAKRLLPLTPIWITFPSTRAPKSDGARWLIHPCDRCFVPLFSGGKTWLSSSDPHQRHSIWPIFWHFIWHSIFSSLFGSMRAQLAASGARNRIRIRACPAGSRARNRVRVPDWIGVRDRVRVRACPDCRAAGHDLPDFAVRSGSVGAHNDYKLAEDEDGKKKDDEEDARSEGRRGRGGKEGRKQGSKEARKQGSKEARKQGSKAGRMEGRKEGRQEGREGGKEGRWEGGAPLLKSRDPHLTGGEIRKHILYLQWLQLNV